MLDTLLASQNEAKLAWCSGSDPTVYGTNGPSQSLAIGSIVIKVVCPYSAMTLVSEGLDPKK